MEQLGNINRALMAMCRFNRALLRAGDEAALLHEACRVMVEDAGYRAVRIGRVQGDERQTIRPVADAGFGTGNRAPLDLSWADAHHGGYRRVVRTGNPCVIRHIQTAPGAANKTRCAEASAGMREDGLRLGFTSAVILPIRGDAEVIGVMTVMAAEPDAFGDQETAMLSDACANLGIGIELLRANSGRLESEREIQRLNRALRTRAGIAHALIHSSDETTLLQEVCRLVVEDSGYGLAWMGYVRQEEADTLRLMVQAGFDREFLALPGARSAMEHTCRFAETLGAGGPHVVRDIEEFDSPLREEARRRGCHSAILLPWNADRELVGTLHILALEPDAFDEQEIELLAATTAELGFGIAAMRTRARALAAEETIRKMAYSDALTGLPNHLRLRELLEQALCAARHDRRPLSLLYIEVGRGGEIDETLGYREADRLQQEVAVLLERTAGPGNPVARTGEREFAVLMPGGGAEHASQLARKLLDALHDPIELSGLFLEARASIGIALFPGHGSDPDALLHRARIALEPAKRSALGYSLFKGGLDKECSQRLALMRDLRYAIERNELLLYYQPQLRIGTNRVDGAEALIRWLHPQYGLLGPETFIGLAERSGLITPLTYWVLETALCQCYDWHQDGIERRVSVNLSARDLRDPKLVDRIGGAFATWGAKADWLEFELTESALMEDPVVAMETLGRLKDLDARLAIDDFGTGQSSLAYLQNLPVDTLKIDQSFVSRMTRNPGSARIVHSVIDLAHTFGLTVVAEGVEDRETLARLGALSCDVAQGYGIGQPIPASQFSEWEAHSEWH